MDYQVVSLRLFMAILCAGLIGYDRQKKNRPAGLRTHILVCIGATTISMIQAAVFYEKLQVHPEINVDQVRLLAPIVSGIGFIIVTKQRVAGLTTAASLWTTAGMGIAIGMGYYEIAILTCVAVMFSLTVIRRIVHMPNVKRLEIKYIHRVATKEFLTKFFESRGIELTDILFDVENSEGRRLYRNIFTVHVPEELSLPQLIEELATHPDIRKIHLVSISE